MPESKGSRCNHPSMRPKALRPRSSPVWIFTRSLTSADPRTTAAWPRTRIERGHVEHAVAAHRAGQFTGELTLIAQGRSLVRARARGQTVLLRLEGPALRSLVQTALAEAGLSLERRPYIFETSHPHVFAIGDVRASSVKRVASAVGEGAICTQLVHTALAE